MGQDGMRNGAENLSIVSSGGSRILVKSFLEQKWADQDIRSVWQENDTA